jgi:CRISPR-associated protein Cpf1
MINKKESIFKDFTNLYSLTKTLRFELKPTIETKSLAEVIKEDKEIDRLYNEEMKIMLDSLHEDFITESLENVKLPFDLLVDLEKRLLEKEQIRKDKKISRAECYELESKKIEEIDILQKELRLEIVELFNKNGSKWKVKKYAKLKLKDSGYKILTEAAILEVLKVKYPKKRGVIEKFSKFFTYFSGFNKNRENYYSSEDKATSIANRIINENLSRFLDNKQKFKELLEKMPQIIKFEKCFLLENYNNYLTQEGIENFNEEIIGEVNKSVNLFSQQNKNILTKAPRFKVLYKQIGCGKKTFNMFQVEEGKEWAGIDKLINEQNKKIKINLGEGKLLDYIKNLYVDFFKNPDKYELDKIYFNKTSINTISNLWFANWHKLSELLSAKKVIKNKNKESGEYIIPEKILVADLKEILECEKNVSDLFKNGKIDKKEDKGEYEKLYKENAWLTFLSIWKYEIDKNFSKIDVYIKEFINIKQEKFNKKKHTEFIKGVCDAFLAIERMVKYHKVKEEEEKDGDFYLAVDLFLKESVLHIYYDAFRNYLTQKPFVKEKIKLNFENGSLLGGWSDGQEMNKGAVILQNTGKYYLGIMKDRQFFRTDKNNELYVENSKWQRLILTNLKFQTLAGKGFLGRYKESYGDMGKKDSLKAVASLQEFIKEKYIGKYPKLKNLSERKYETKKEFDKDVKEALESSFDMHFVSINENLLIEGVKKGKLFLFEIVNKDFIGEERKSNKNLHSLYWLELFSNKNLTKPTLALNGGGEIFFRNGQREKLNKKLDKSGKEVLDAKRYAEDKIFFHVPITINYGKPKNLKFRELINNQIKNRIADVNILGICC